MAATNPASVGSQTAPAAPAAPPVGGGLVGLTPRDARRVSDAVSYVERVVRGGTPGRRREGGGICPAVLATLSGSLSAASSATAPTSQTATLRLFDGTTLTADTGTTTIYNYHNKTFASGALVMAAYAAGYWWVVDARDCPT